MSRAWGLLAGLTLSFALMFLVGWPVVATVLEATRAVAKLEGSLRRSGWTRLADALDQWKEIEFSDDDEPVAALDPAGTAALLRETRGLARPVRLGLETTGLVLATEALALPIGVLLAIFLFRTDIWGRRVMLALVAITAFVPLPLQATAWLGRWGMPVGCRYWACGRSWSAGSVRRSCMRWRPFPGSCCWRASACAQSSRSWKSPRRWNSGHGACWTQVTIRRAIGAIAAAALAVAVLTAGDMTVTDLLQIRTYAEETFVQFILGHGLADAAIVALPPMVILALMILLVGRALSRSTRLD